MQHLPFYVKLLRNVTKRFTQVNISLYILVLIFLLIFFLLYFFPTNTNRESSPVIDGSVDVHGKTHFRLPLCGEWDFVQNDFRIHNWQDAVYALVPGTWSGNRFGYASYRVTLKGLVPDYTYTLRVPYQATAYSLFIDGKLLAKNGKIGTTRKDSEPEYRFQIINFKVPDTDAELVLQVSNFFHRRGGLFQTIMLGDKDSIWQTNYWLFFTDWSFVVVFLSMSIYQLALWIVRRDKAILLMSMVLFFMGMNGMFDTTNVLVFSLLPNLPWELYEKICYFTSYTTAPLLLLFLQEMYGGISSKLLTFLIAPTLAIFLFILITPAYIFTPFNHFFQMYAFFEIAVCFAVIISAIISRRPSSLYMLFAFIIIFGCILSGAYFSNNRISLGTFLPLSFLNYYNNSLTIISLPLNVVSYVLLLILINIFSLAYFLKHPGSTKRKIPVGEMQNSPDLQARIAEYGLSTREIEVCLLMLQGKTNKEISSSLFISLSTIKTHISRIFKKTEVSSRTELFFLFHQQVQVNALPIRAKIGSESY